MNAAPNAGSEQHPFFPSGEWEGFFMYRALHDTEQHKMAFTLHFCEQAVTGMGSDNVGAFGWNGVYDIRAGTCKMTKFYYGQHAVFYDGHVDENGIWGTWAISAHWTGVFHIWPKKQNIEEEIRAKETTSERVATERQITLTLLLSGEALWCQVLF
jgi:hypothetical protein